jgi:hypothetical protein
MVNKFLPYCSHKICGKCRWYGMLIFSFPMIRWKNRMNSWLCPHSLLDLHIQHIQIPMETIPSQSSLWTTLVTVISCVSWEHVYIVLFLECKLYWITRMILTLLYLVALVTEGVSLHCYFCNINVWKFYLHDITLYIIMLVFKKFKFKVNHHAWHNIVHPESAEVCATMIVFKEFKFRGVD